MSGAYKIQTKVALDKVNNLPIRQIIVRILFNLPKQG